MPLLSPVVGHTRFEVVGYTWEAVLAMVLAIVVVVVTVVVFGGDGGSVIAAVCGDDVVFVVVVGGGGGGGGSWWSLCPHVIIKRMLHKGRVIAPLALRKGSHRFKATIGCKHCSQGFLSNRQGFLCIIRVQQIRS